MFNKKRILGILSLLVICSVILFFILSYIENSAAYQLDRLANGTVEEKIIASDFVRMHRLEEAMPFLIDNINTNKEFLFSNKVRRTLPCASIKALEEITGARPSNFNACYDSILARKDLLDGIKDDWQRWYSPPQYKAWQVYKNERLGFEIKYPVSYQGFDAECSFENGKYKLSYGIIPTKIFEQDNKVYIAHEYFYKVGTDGCEKVSYSIDNLKDFGFWEIIIEDNIKNDDDLDKFVKDFFYDTCTLGEKKPALQDNVFDIYTYYDGKNLGTLDCFINYMAVMKYYPGKNKAVAWDMGQEYIFSVDNTGKFTLDREMVDSFRFLE